MQFIPVLLLVIYMPLAAHGAAVTRVIDGDTVVLDHATTIRLYGIDCPEGGQAGGDEATEATNRLTLVREVEPEILYTDRYGRTVAVLWFLDGSTLQEALLKEGMAWVTPRYCRRPECREWREEETRAREVRLGLWQNPQPVPPWEWRKNNR